MPRGYQILAQGLGKFRDTVRRRPSYLRLKRWDRSDPELSEPNGNGLQWVHNYKKRFVGATASLALGAILVLYSFQEIESKCDTGDNKSALKRKTPFYITPGEDSDMKLFSGNGNWSLANEICMHLGTQLGRTTVKRFSDGEVSVQIHDNVRGKDVFVVQPLGPPTNENLIELLLMVTTLRRSSARNITAVIPYYGYCRSTAVDIASSPVAAADVATMLQVAGVDRVLTVDLHHSQIKGFFGPKTIVDNLDVSSLAVPYFASKFLVNPVVVSPDTNGAARAQRFRKKLMNNSINADLALIVDHNMYSRKTIPEMSSGTSPENNARLRLEKMDLVGDVKGCDCIIFDDMISSGSRIIGAVEKLRLAGARRVFAFATHGLFLGDAYEKIERSDLIEVVCVNTLPLVTVRESGITSWIYTNKVHQLSVAALLAEAIRRIHKNISLSDLDLY